MNVSVRKANDTDYEILTDISFAAKRYWNYPEEYMDIWKNELTITPEYIHQNIVFVAEVSATIIGYFSIVEIREDIWAGKVFVKKGFWLEHIFIKPEFIGKGIGTELIHFLKDLCHKKDISCLYIFSDPHAKGFYVKIGAKYIKECFSSIEGRTVSLFELKNWKRGAGMLKIMVDQNTELRLLEVADAEQLFMLTDSCRSYLREWLPWLDKTTQVSDTKSYIEISRKQFESNNGFQTGIWYKGNIAGVIGLHGISWANKSTDVGYWLGEKYRGHGIMTESCRALVNYAFGDMKLNRVEVRCAEQNYRSRAIPERLGFKIEGTIKEAEWLYDHYVDHKIYAILVKEWFIG